MPAAGKDKIVQTFPPKLPLFDGVHSVANQILDYINTALFFRIEIIGDKNFWKSYKEQVKAQKLYIIFLVWICRSRLLFPSGKVICDCQIIYADQNFQEADWENVLDNRIIVVWYVFVPAVNTIIDSKTPDYDGNSLFNKMAQIIFWLSKPC